MSQMSMMTCLAVLLVLKSVFDYIELMGWVEVEDGYDCPAP